MTKRDKNILSAATLLTIEWDEISVADDDTVYELVPAALMQRLRDAFDDVEIADADA